MPIGKRKDGRFYPKTGGRGSVTDHKRLKEMEEARRKKTIRQLNYDGGDYTGKNASTRSRQLDRQRHNKRQPWENR